MTKELLIRADGDYFVVPELNRQIPKTNYRELTLDTKAAVSDERTIDLSVSSDKPYTRWWYHEILEHSDEAVDLSRMNDSAMSLYNHNRDDYLGVIEKAWLEDGKLYNTIRFDDHELAEKIVRSINKGIIKNVSIGYIVHELVLVKKSDDDLNIYKATKWTPFESSFVTVPADASVGVGRQFYDMGNLITGEVKEFTPDWEKLNQRIDQLVSEYQNSEEIRMGDENKTAVLEAVNEKDIRQQERDRIAAITAAGNKYGCVEIAQRAVDDGITIEQARSLFADQVLTKSQTPVAQPLEPLGFSRKETKNYSIRNAILYKMGQIHEGAAGLEIEASKAIANKLGKPPEGIYIPTGDLEWSATRATYATGAPATGGTTLETELLSENFIEALRSQLVIRKLGATILSGLEGNVDIPRQASTAGTVWVGEGATITQFESTFDKISLTPKTVATRSVYTRNMLLQSSMDIEAFIRNDLVQSIALEIDRVAIAGNGIGQPLGIINYPGVNAVVIGANGGAPTWQTMVNLETEVALDDALMGTCHYLTNSKVRGKLKTTEKANATGMFIWENDREIGSMGSVNGYGAAVTNQIPGNLNKGTGTNLSVCIFGDFSSLIVGEWGILDLLPNQFGTGYEQGNVQVRAMQTVDVNLRRPQYFAVCSDINTI
jgi:HK97 family phage major capsid protein/HK97 family phage prohead protease